MTAGKMITDPELLEVREYLGQELLAPSLFAVNLPAQSTRVYDENP